MSLLIDRSGQVSDSWTRVEAAGDLPLVEGPAIVPFDAIDEALDQRRNAALGIHVDNHVLAEAIEPYLGAVALVSVAFPSFGDGRGFSLGRRLRRLGFSGTLRASGPLIADQFVDALACGFDEVELPDAVAGRQPAEQWVEARARASERYQSGYAEGQSILEKRRAARKGGAS